MFERFSGEARAAVVAARERAARSGASAVEPEDVLLALASASGTRAADALARLGLDDEVLAEAVARDEQAVLEAVGVRCFPVERADEIGEVFAAAADIAFNSTVSAAVLVSQRVIGAKGFGQK